MKAAFLDSVSLLCLLAGLYLACEFLATGGTLDGAGLRVLAGLVAAGFFQCD